MLRRRTAATLAALLLAALGWWLAGLALPLLGAEALDLPARAAAVVLVLGGYEAWLARVAEGHARPGA
ncbi:hypothetical protein [Paracraurococcus ruber]|uniref:Uncharacterized protein n=1 Tax=Paracraurococcus ruber TaxID=77675 RepID=A0ABS1D803_9PROT|nr:hypothetical protein [Paracraurococcus ruber]MBK1662192.1 hypothetical protein [Paracraurococcus ruber]TDG14494.1 hypothetical protein E2C05_29905 [Paracraurococcus ruber]